LRRILFGLLALLTRGPIHAAAMIAALIAAEMTEAGVTFFSNDLAGFTTAMVPHVFLGTEDFEEGVDGGSSVLLSSPLEQGIANTAAFPSGLIQPITISHPSMHFFPAGASLNLTDVVMNIGAISASTPLAYSFNASDTISGVGFDHIQLAGGTQDVSVFDTNGALLGLINIAGDSAGSNFLGIEANGGDLIGRIELGDFTGSNNNGADNIQLFQFSAANLNWVGGSSNWSNADNWDPPLLPEAISNVSINQTASLTVTGPTSQTEIASLLVDSQNAGSNATLDLQSAGALTVSGVTTIGTRGRIAGSGMLIATGGVTNSGELDLAAGLHLAGGTLINNGSLIGGGQVDNLLANGISGDVRIAAGQQLKFTDTGAHSNAGRIEAIGSTSLGQAELEVTGSLTNAVGGLVAVRASVVRFSSGLDNEGQLSFGPGVSDLFGDVNNIGIIGLSGGATTSIIGGLAQYGTLNLLSGSHAIVFADFTGTGGTTGPGTLDVLGTLSPGASPAEVSFGGDLNVGVATLMELGGTETGQFDRLVVGGTTTLAGTLDVQLIGGFTPTAGDMFEIITATSVLGTFATETLPPLAGGLEWFVNYSATSVELVSTFAGDFDFDGDVDGADFLEWQQGLGTIYDATDLDAWEANYGAVAPLSETSAAVPEPTTSALALAALCLAISGRRISAR